MTTLAQIETSNPLAPPPGIGDLIANYVFASLSPSSQRVYGHTFDQWIAFARANAFNPLQITFETVSAFVSGSDLAKSTRQNRLSHMRKLLHVLALLQPQYMPDYQRVKGLLKIKRVTADSARQGHSKRALSDGELTAALDVWRYDTRPVGLRNNAMIRLLVFTGMRRSELVALRWSDIHFDTLTITVHHGKGDKSRVVAILDPSPVTKLALQALRDTLAQATETRYQHVFPRMTARRNPRFAEDLPCDAETVAVVVRHTAAQARIGHFSPHDLRRSHITAALNSGATVADMQAQAGHTNAATTLIYAQSSDAAARHNRVKLNVS